jgi:hypothetical protein
MTMLEQVDLYYGDRARELFLAGTHTYHEALQQVCRELIERGWLPARRTWSR